MLWEAISRYEGGKDEASRKMLEQVVERAARKIADEDATPEGFRKARDNVAILFRDLPKGVEAPLPKRLEEVSDGSFSACPFWPFC